MNRYLSAAIAVVGLGIQSQATSQDPSVFPPPPVTIPPHAGGADDKAVFVLKFDKKDRGIPINPVEKYLRIRAVDPSPVSQLTINERQGLDQIWASIRQAIARTESSLHVGVTSKVGGTLLPQQSIYYYIQKNTDDPISYREPADLTPFFSSDKTLNVQISARRGRKMESDIAKLLVDAARAASTLVSGSAPLLAAIAVPTMDATAKKIDSALDKAFTGTSEYGVPLNFDISKHEQVLVTLEAPGAKPVKLMSIQIDAFDSLIAADGTNLNTFPESDADVAKFSVSEKTSASDLLLSNNDVMTSLNAETAAGFKDFCRKAANTLAKAGLNRYDRAAVIAMYLRTTTWNALTGMRNPNPANDQCTIATADLARTNLKDKLKTFGAIEKESVVDRRAAEQFLRDTFFPKLATAAESRDAAVWSGLLAGKVSLNAQGESMLLSKYYSINAGVSDPFSVDDAADLLSRYLIYTRPDKDQPGEKKVSCMTLFAASSSTTFRSQCFSLKVGDVVTPLYLNFETDGAFGANNADPKVVRIRFYRQ